MARCFRNEGISSRHNPEFTLLEAYSCLGDSSEMMSLVECTYLDALNATRGLVNKESDRLPAPPWPRRPLLDLIEEHTSIDFSALSDEQSVAAAADYFRLSEEGSDLLDGSGDIAVGGKGGSEESRTKRLSLDSLSWAGIIQTVFDKKVVPKLLTPIHVTQFPLELSTLAKEIKNQQFPNSRRYCDRFETYMRGWELANGYSELTDPIEQRKRMEERKGGATVDKDFISALESGMPPAGGVGIGIDRLVALVMNRSSIREVVSFPLVRSVSLN